MRMQSSHPNKIRKLDAYFSPYEAVVSLLQLERQHLPRYIWEPAAGNGAIVKPFRKAGYKVIATDITHYDFPLTTIQDYLQISRPARVQGIVTNPPYKLATEFVEKALNEVSYAVFLLRTNFLESIRRKPLFCKIPPARVWIASRRLPMMHRYQWKGPKAGSNTCYAWFVWDKNSRNKGKLGWFDWQELMARN